MAARTIDERRRGMWSAIGLQWVAAVLSAVSGHPGVAAFLLFAAFGFVAFDGFTLGPLMRSATDAVDRAEREMR